MLTGKQIAGFKALGLPVPEDPSLEDMRVLLREASIKSLYFFSTAILGWTKIQLEPHKELCDFIQNVDAPHKRRKVLLIPRDCYKSTVASKSFPLWILIQPMFCGLKGLEHRILLWSHSSDNAKKQIKSIRQQVERNTLLRWLFPEIIPENIAKTTWTDSNLLFPRTGNFGEDTIEAAGLDTHLVSRHYTIQIKDDLEDKASFEQPSVRQKVKDTYKSAEALFVDERLAYDLLVGTRWGVDDVYADIQKNESDAYEFLVRPLHWTRDDLEADLKNSKETGEQPIWNMDPNVFAPDSNKVYYFFEQLFPADSCKRIKAKQGQFMYSMLYLNNPRDQALAEFKEDNLRYFNFNDEGDLVLYFPDGTTETVMFSYLRRVLFWDPAMTEKEQKKRARNAMVVMYKDHKGRLFLAEAYATFSNPTTLFQQFINYHLEHSIHKAAIEDVTFQRTLKFPLFHLMKEVNHVFSVEELAPIGSKHARIRSLIPYTENGEFWTRRGLKDFVLEYKNFPVFNTVDILDAAAACVPMLDKAVASPREQRTAMRIVNGSNGSAQSTRSPLTGY